MCLAENANRGHSVKGFVEKKVIRCGIKKWPICGVSSPPPKKKGGSFGVNYVKFSENLQFSFIWNEIFEMHAKRAKNCKYYVEILKQKGVNVC